MVQRLQSSPNPYRPLLQKQAWIEQMLNRFESAGGPAPDGLPLDIRRALHCIHNHLFDTRLNVDFVRSRCQLRNNNVSTRFRRALGRSLREYIEEQRIAAASRLLSNQKIEIFLIAMAVGYEYQETFCRAFRRQLGCPPSVYRQNLAGDHVP